MSIRPVSWHPYVLLPTAGVGAFSWITDQNCKGGVRIILSWLVTLSQFNYAQLSVTIYFIYLFSHLLSTAYKLTSNVWSQAVEGMWLNACGRRHVVNVDYQLLESLIMHFLDQDSFWHIRTNTYTYIYIHIHTYMAAYMYIYNIYVTLLIEMSRMSANGILGKTAKYESKVIFFSFSNFIGNGHSNMSLTFLISHIWWSSLF